MTLSIKKFFFAITLIAVLSAPAVNKNRKNRRKELYATKLYNKNQADQIVKSRIKKEHGDDEYAQKVMHALVKWLYSDGRNHTREELDNLLAGQDEEKNDRYGTI